MKKHHSIAWSLCALAVIASPLTLDHVVSLQSHHEIYRSIANEDAEPAEVDEPIVAGPVLSEEDRQPVDREALLRFNTSQADAIAAVPAPEASTLSGGELLQSIENDLVQVQRDSKEIQNSLTQLLEGSLPEVATSRNSERDKLINQVARLNHLGNQFVALNSDESVDANLRDLTQPILEAVRDEVAKACLALENLDTRVAELEQAATPVVAEPEASPAPAPEATPAISSELQERLDRADRIIARYERLEKERSCRASQATPVVTPTVTQDVSQMQMMMMNMISMNQTMITMMQMQMQQNMSGGYFSQPSWPMQNYYGMGIGQNGPSYALTVPYQQPQLPIANVPTQSAQPQFSPMIQNFYGGQQGPVMGLPGAQFPQVPGGGFNFGSTDGGAAVFGNFSSVGGNPVASNPAQGIPFSF